MDSTVKKSQLFTPEVLKKIDLFLESIYPESEKTGLLMAKKELKNTQVRKLEKIITSASRFSEIINFIKNQVGKDNEHKWLPISEIMLEQLKGIENKAIELGCDDDLLIMEMKLKITRGWARQVACHYFYSNKSENGHKP